MLGLVPALVLAGCSSGWSDEVLAGGPRDVAALAVTGAEPVDVEGAVRLSPDGSRLLHLSGDQCVSAVDGTDRRCVDRDEVGGDLLRATWSPDGTKLAFTDDYWRALYEPDVWVFDVTSGELRNLTDDGQDDPGLGGSDSDADIDLLPSWSPDGEAIRFARGGGGSETAELMSVPAEGGEVSLLREVPCAAPTLVALAWSADRVAWTCGVTTGEVRMADHSGGETELVLRDEGREHREDRMLLSFSPDGQWLLVDSLHRYATFARPDDGRVLAVPADGGEPVLVAGGEAAYPTWAPRGHAMAYVDPPGTVNVVAEPGGEPRELHGAEAVTAADGQRLDWAPGRLLAVVDREPVLLALSG